MCYWIFQVWTPPMLTAIATICVAIYSYRNYKTTESIKTQTKEFQEKYEDLLLGIVVSNLVTDYNNKNQLTSKKEAFKKLYNGRTKLFIEHNES